uniref:Uncharacterized protein n=1 Tax=Tenebrio molitor TaxID=7067 RepID=A0A8J6H3G1_TENMO|nr:hypothetical protein GEV33_015495 [Tenebrio molitor]
MLALKSPGFISYFSFISRFANIAPPNYSKIIPKDKSPAIKQMSATHHRPLSLSHLTPQGGVNIPTPAASYNSLPLSDPAGYKASEYILRRFLAGLRLQFSHKFLKRLVPAASPRNWRGKHIVCFLESISSRYK